MDTSRAPGAEGDRIRKTILNQRHVALGAKMGPFAGWEMPIHYPAGIFAEHRAVRATAGLFDVSHMMAIEVSGVNAAGFLDGLLANRASRLSTGQAHYSTALAPDGTHIDDLFVYRLGGDRFMIVANAVNGKRLLDWMVAVNAGREVIDLESPSRRLDSPVRIRDLRDAGEDSLVGFALQGPSSGRLLAKMADSDTHRRTVEDLVKNRHATARIAGVGVRLARTGYTGEKMGFEVFVHPEQAGALWDAILQAGAPLGALPAGLGARDSSRLEAGLPLFGHEIEGPLGLSLTEAGYGFAVRSDAPFVIGRARYAERTTCRPARHLLRLRGQGRRTVRPGHVILDNYARPAAEVTSFAYPSEDLTFVVLACSDGHFRPEIGSLVLGVRCNRQEATEAWPTEGAQSIVDLTVLPRFPDDLERAAWAVRYSG